MTKKNLKVPANVCTVTFTKMWLEGSPTRIIAETLRISADRCDVARRALKLPRRESWHNSKAGKRTAYLPSPEEIRQKCLEFQATWSDEERSRRLVGGSQSPLPVEIRVISDSAFSGGYSGGGDERMSIEDLADTSGA
jgi:hypothetical protein